MQLEARAEVVAHRRSFDLDDVEIREDADTGAVTFEGVASVVDHPYKVRDRWGEYTETIRAGAFDKTLSELAKRGKKSDFGLFVNHEYGAPPLATVASGRLEVFADPNLRVRAALNPLRPSVQEIRHAVKDGEMRQMSIGFNIVKGKDIWNDDMSEVVRTEVKALEASIVWQGANGATSGKMRSLTDLALEYADDAENAEDALRAAISELQARLPQIHMLGNTAADPEAVVDAIKRYEQRNGAAWRDESEPGLRVTREMIELFGRRFPAA